MPDQIETLIQYRMQTAEEKLTSAKTLLESGSYKDSIGRSYYAMFSAVRAILAQDKTCYQGAAAPHLTVLGPLRAINPF